MCIDCFCVKVVNEVLLQASRRASTCGEEYARWNLPNPQRTHVADLEVHFRLVVVLDDCEGMFLVRFHVRLRVQDVDELCLVVNGLWGLHHYVLLFFIRGGQKVCVRTALEDVTSKLELGTSVSNKVKKKHLNMSRQQRGLTLEQEQRTIARIQEICSNAVPNPTVDRNSDKWYKYEDITMHREDLEDGMILWVFFVPGQCKNTFTTSQDYIYIFSCTERSHDSLEHMYVYLSLDVYDDQVEQGYADARDRMTNSCNDEPDDKDDYDEEMLRKHEDLRMFLYEFGAYGDVKTWDRYTMTELPMHNDENVFRVKHKDDETKHFLFYRRVRAHDEYDLRWMIKDKDGTELLAYFFTENGGEYIPMPRSRPPHHFFYSSLTDIYNMLI